MCHLKLKYQTDLTVFKENTNTPPSTRPIKDTDKAVDKIGTPKTYHTTIQRNPPVKKRQQLKNKKLYWQYHWFTFVFGFELLVLYSIFSYSVYSRSVKILSEFVFSKFSTF